MTEKKGLSTAASAVIVVLALAVVLAIGWYFMRPKHRVVTEQNYPPPQPGMIQDRIPSASDQ